MSYTPAQVNEMTLWEFSCCLYAEEKKSSSGEISESRLRELGIEGF